MSPWWDCQGIGGTFQCLQPPELHTSSYSAFSNSLNILTFNLLNSAPHTNPLPAQVQCPCSYLSPVFRIVFCLDLGSPWVQENSLMFCFSSFFSCCKGRSDVFSSSLFLLAETRILWFLLMNIGL